MGAMISHKRHGTIVPQATSPPQAPRAHLSSAEYRPPTPASPVDYADPPAAAAKKEAPRTNKPVQAGPALTAVASGRSWLSASSRFAGLQVDPTAKPRRPGEEKIDSNASSVAADFLDEPLVQLYGSSARLVNQVDDKGDNQGEADGESSSGYDSDTSSNDGNVFEHGFDVDTPMFGRGEEFRAALLDGFSSPSIKALHAHGALLMSPAAAMLSDIHQRRLQAL